MRALPTSVVLVILFLLGPSSLLRSEDRLEISEFMAVNGNGLDDEDRDEEDWIEIHNAGTRAVNLDGWYLTGDMGYVANGEVYIVGRLKDLIINAGKNIYPQDIEAIVNTVPGVHAGRAVAFGVPDEREGTELVAIVAEVNTEDAAERKRIATQIRQTVARQSMITVSYVHLVDSRWLIKTSSGKIARRANRDRWLADVPSPTQPESRARL